MTVAGAWVPAYTGQVGGRTFVKKKPAQQRARKQSSARQSTAMHTLPRGTVVTAAAVWADHRVVLGPQRACEAILGRELDKGAFRRKSPANAAADFTFYERKRRGFKKKSRLCPTADIRHRELSVLGTC